MTDKCSRCKGTGFFRASAGVMHYGVPGLCYGCDGAGTKEAQLAKKQAQKVKEQKEIEYRSNLLNDMKIKALAIYDAYEMGYITRESKRNRWIEQCITECQSVGISREEFKAYRVTDEVAVKLACEAYR